jgi:hypothetical protein
MKKEKSIHKEKSSFRFNPINFIKTISNKRRIVILFSFLLCAALIFQAVITIRVQAASRTISGRVFQDYDGDGTFDTTQTITNNGSGTIAVGVDRGIQGVTVTAYDTLGAVQPAATTAADGTYTITTLAGSTGPYRIEFTNLPAGYSPGARSTDSVNGGTATNSGTTVQFVADANTTNVNLAINHPSDYSENNPLLSTSTYSFGHRDDTPIDALTSFPYSAGSADLATYSAAQYTSPAENPEGTKAQVGSVFGLAYRRSTDTLYAAAFMKRHTGIGPGGTGAIYQIANVSNAAAGTPSVFATVPNAGADTHPTTSGGGVIWEQDFNTFTVVGRRGLGGLEISEDGTRLFVVNLNNRELYEIPVATGVPVSRGLIPNPTCTNGVGRPFALKMQRDTLYVGGLCTAENVGGTAANMQAYVYAYNPSTATFGASPVLSFPLNYTRGCVDDGQSDPTCHAGEENAEWRPWVSTLNFNTLDVDNDTQVVYPQPIFTDIEFAGNDMILGFRDRIGDQGGNGSRNPGDAAETTQYVTNTAGDILRANPNVSGGWTIENNSQSNPTGTFGPTAGQNNGHGPGNGEFYHGEIHVYHDEVSNGGLAQIPGFPHIVLTAMDPANFGGAVWDGGVRWLNNGTTSGAMTKGYITYDGNRLDTLFGKANGIGELEPLSRRAPVEIGSRVWRDTDNDGAQDPVNGATEAGIQTVTVRLYRPGFGPDGIAGNADDNTALATAVTDANGEYYFISGTGDGDLTNNIGILNGNILPNTAYEIRIDNNANFLSGGALFTGGAALNLTVPNATAQAGNDDSSDSDGLYDPNTACSATNNQCPTVSFTTGPSGANDHKIDFGFTTGTTYTPTTTFYSVGNRIWFDTNNDSSLTGENGIPNIMVNIFADADNNGTPDDINSPLQTVWTTSGAGNTGYYRFDGLVAGNYVVRVDPKNFDAGGPLAGYQNTTATEADPDSAGDSNDNGINPANANNPLSSTNGILSGAITVGPGTAEPTGETDVGTIGQGVADNRADMTLDFGFYRMCLNGIVWTDTNNNGLLAAPETGIVGMRVRIYQSDGTTEIPVGPDGILGTADDGNGGMFTNSTGNYSFCGLANGDYIVKAQRPPLTQSSNAVGYEPGPDPDNNTPNDDNGTQGTGVNAGLLVSSAITLSAGGEPTINNATGTTTNATLDFGVNPTPSAVTLVSFNAYQEGDRVLLKWESGYEVDNLGYNVIRETDGKRKAINNSMIAGSALKVGVGIEMTAGNAYLWTDSLSVDDANAGVRYWLEAVDINGQTEMFGPFVPEVGNFEIDSVRRAKTLDEIGRDANDVLSQRELPTAFVQKNQKKVDRRKASAIQSEQFDIANQSAAKITVRRDGWYRVSREQLASAGFNLLSDKSRWQLFADAQEQSIRVNNDGSIEFYGKAVDTRSTDGQIYWLIVGQTQGRRIGINNLDGGDVNEPSTFTQTIERRDKVLRFSALLNGEAENYFGPTITANTETNQSIFIAKPDNRVNTTVAIEVGVQGMTLQDHSVEIKLNGNILGTINSSGHQRPSMRFDVPISSVREGKNNVTLISRNAGSDVSLVDFVRVTYPRKAEAVENRLTFSTNAGQTARVTGFTTNQLRVIDVTNQSSPIEISATVRQTGNGYAFSLPPTSNARKIMAFAVGQENATTEVFTNYPSELNRTNNSADLLIITNGMFGKAAEDLRERRQSQGLNTMVVDIEDVYDEFSFGRHDANALRQFLRHALTNWQGKPDYVLLIGDASYDPRNYFGGGGEASDLVPTMMVDTDYLETASDETLVDGDGDGIGEAAIGRLPARTSAEARTMVRKLLDYEQANNGNPIERGGVMVSDVSGDYDFVGGSQDIRAQLPNQMPVQFINRNDGDVATVRQRIQTAINAGPAILNYMGHGSTTSWTNAVLFNGADAMNLQNGSRLPLAVLMTCANGSFGEDNFDSMAESLLKSPNGGAVAVWASSGLSAPDKQVLVNSRFYQEMFSDQTVRFGDAVRTAKQATQDQNVRRTWIFFGDPTMRLR